MLRERYISLEKRQKIIHDLRFIQCNIIMEFQKIYLQDDTTNEPSKLRQEIWLMNHEKRVIKVFKLNLKLQS